MKASNLTRSDNKVGELANSGQKPQYGLMTLAYQPFTAVLLMYGSLLLSGVYYCLSMLWCAVARMSELELNFLLNLARVEAKSGDVSASLQG
jgi:hypothetical protein